MSRIIIDDVQRHASHGAFGATLALSLAVHLGLAALLPDADHGPRATPARPLEVVLAEPPVMEPRRRLPEPPRALPAQRERPQPPRAAPAPKSAAPPHEILGLPAESGPSPVTVVAPEAHERQAKPEPAPPAPVAAPSAPVRESVIPARYDAAYLRNPAPRYPISARRSGISGAVDLKVRVTPDGRAAEVQVQRTSGSSVLDGSALEAVRTWQFVPERRGHTPVESWIVVPIVFKLENAR